VSVLLVTPQHRRRAEQLLASARIHAAWRGPPTADEIKKLDVERLLHDPMLADEGTEEDRAMAQSLLAVHSAETIAKAFIHIYRAQSPAPEDLADPGSARESHGPRDRQREPHPRRPDREQRPGASAPRASGNRVWFRLNVGRQKKADPKWLIPEICRQGKVTKPDIGAIRIFDDETRFEINEDVAARFTDAIQNAKKSELRIELSSAPTQSAPERRQAVTDDKRYAKPQATDSKAARFGKKRGTPYAGKPSRDRDHRKQDGQAPKQRRP